MSDLRKAAQMALEAIGLTQGFKDAVVDKMLDDAMDALEDALAQPERKPLTEEEIERIANSVRVDPIHAKKPTWHIRLIRAVEKAHGIENV